MDKLQMCRICLAENVHMYVVVNKTLLDLYEKLTGNPFITEDSRPILACFICCAQLKKCYRFQKKCLEAEEMFAKMMNEEYERKPLINQDQFEFFHGFIRTSIDTISIVDVDQTESIVVKEELPEVCERLNDVIETNEEQESDIDLKTVNIYDNYLDVEVPPLTHTESDSEDDVPLIDVSTEAEEQESSTRKRKSEKTFKASFVAKKRNLETGTIKVADTSTAEQKKTAMETIQDTLNRTSKPFIARKKKIQNSIHNTVVDINCRTNSNEEVTVVKDFKPYKCDINPNSLENSDIHSHEKPFQCNICQRRFNRKYFLIRHKRKHTGEKMFKCDICRYSSSEKSALIKHILIHTGEKPFKCDICQFSFRQKGALKQHKLIHTGEKPYQCHICQCAFSQKSSLTRHFLTHTGEKPYKCDICNRSFSGSGNLKNHVRTHTGEKPYQCNICHRSFRHTFSLNRHMKQQRHTDQTVINKKK